MKKLYLLLTVGILSSISSVTVEAQNEPFNCDYNAYLFQFNDVYALDLASGSSYLVASDITNGNINGAGYNATDGYIWGSLSAPQKSIVRIGKDFSTTTHTINGLPSQNRYIGDVSPNGVYYLKPGGQTCYKVDINPTSPGYLQLIEAITLSQNINIHDWAFNAVDGMMYTVEKNSNKLYRVNPNDGSVTSLGVVPILDGLSYTYGAVYFDVTGRFYVSANQTGTIYVIQSVQNLNGTNSIDSNLFAFGPSSSSNDGARCPTAPVPQEICDNGIDDDGDGLIDCDDPSCSGYGDCEEIDPETSSGNSGGLESNNRLSQAINKRNYGRARNGFSFSKSTAETITKSASYGLSRNASNLNLENFIPLGVIGETQVIESTPIDLIEITNATEVFAVDYLENDRNIASVLALTTNNGVYEHTKYICDRLLGAELLQVSTLSINGYSFIKSIVKNTDNSVEFVLSLSARISEDTSNFEIESHWNLDAYTSNSNFYNFQIWTNTPDNLILLGEELIRLLEVQKPVSKYHLSQPPNVFVKKGNYQNGKLNLEIINKNNTEMVLLDAGFRRTETSTTETTSSTLLLSNSYTTYKSIETGELFDIGFRISSEGNVPDDLFLSDGPWGLDDNRPDTQVTSYEISENSQAFEEDEYPLERNVSMTAYTSSYIGVYRALTPRFMSVNLTDYNGIKFKAAGTGTLEITLVKQSIENWEDQYKATIVLNQEMSNYQVTTSAFKTNSGESTPSLEDVKALVFNLVSENGTRVEKKLNLQQVRFLVLDNPEENVGANNTSSFNYPNPFSGSTTLVLPKQTKTLQLQVFDMTGRAVDIQTLSINNTTSVLYQSPSLRAGIYKYQAIDDKGDVYRGTFLIR